MLKGLLVSLVTALMVAGLAVSQTDLTTVQPANPRDYTLVPTFSVAEPANTYLHFFSEVKDLGVYPLSSDARSLGFNDQQLRALLAVTKALALKSKAILAIAKPLTFEARIHLAGTGKIPSELETERAALEGRWGAMVLDSVRELQEVLPEPLFDRLDEFVRSGKSLFAIPSKGVPIKKTPTAENP